MKNKYVDLIEQTFDFPTDEFKLEEGNLLYKELDLNSLVQKYGTPFKFSYLPVIGEKIDQCRKWFDVAFQELDYHGNYHYSYCTKSSHFNFVLKECLKKGVHIETSSAFDLDMVIELFYTGKLGKNTYILCNGYKTRGYVKAIAKLIELGFTRVIPIIDNYKEFEILEEIIDSEIEIGIRIASEEDPKFEFYTSRLGIGYKDVVPFYEDRIVRQKKFKLSLLHFFVNTGIQDNAYYWNELRKFLAVYNQLYKAGAPIRYLDIGGGLPVKSSLAFNFDYQYMITEIVNQIKTEAEETEGSHPDIFTEFGSYTVSESGGTVFTILDQKQQNDRERWNMINGSFMTTLPDTWAISKRFILLPLNRWNHKYERVFLGGLTCDSDDYYNSEQHVNAIYLPEYKEEEPLHIAFFNTGAYQESISGYGGIKHCLIPAPQHIIIERGENGEQKDFLYRKEQTSTEMLQILGYS